MSTNGESLTWLSVLTIHLLLVFEALGKQPEKIVSSCYVWTYAKSEQVYRTHRNSMRTVAKRRSLRVSMRRY